jgi:hypothetical protein
MVVLARDILIREKGNAMWNAFGPGPWERTIVSLALIGLVLIPAYVCELRYPGAAAGDTMLFVAAAVAVVVTLSGVIPLSFLSIAALLFCIPMAKLDSLFLAVVYAGLGTIVLAYAVHEIRLRASLSAIVVPA